MKIISCYIKGFGTYQNKEFTFSDGLNCLIENNGEGKTTLAHFIEAMLYGLDTYKENSKDFKDRKHYKPFSNATFGGSLIFIHKGLNYKIERTFDNKSQEKDVTKIFIDGIEQKDNKAKNKKPLGEEILKLDRDAFERLMLITPTDINLEAGSNLKKHLNNIIDATSESYNYEDISSNVSKHINRYNRTKDSLINKEEEKNNLLLEKISGQKVIVDNLPNKYKEYKELKKQKEDFQNKLIEKANYETYLTKKNSIKKNTKYLNSLESLYPKSYPNSEELKVLEEANNKLQGLIDNDFTALSDEKLENAKQIKDKYQKGFPSEDELKTLEDLFFQRKEVNTQIIQNTYDETKLSKYESLPYNDVAINNLKEQYQEFVSTNNTLTTQEYSLIRKYQNNDYEKDIKQIEELKNNHIKSNNNNKIFIIILILLFVLMVTGIALIFINMLIGIILTILGVLGLIVIAFVYLMKKIDNKNNSISPKNIQAINNILKTYGFSYENYNDFIIEINNYKTALQKQKDDTDSNISNMLQNTIKQYDVFDEIKVGYENIINNYREYQDLKNKKQEYIKYQNEEKEINNEIETILNKYDINDSFLSYRELEQFIADKENKISNLNKHLENEKNKNENITKYKNLIKRLYDKYELGDKSIDKIKNDINEIKRLDIKLNEEKENLIKFTKENNIEEVNIVDTNFNEKIAELEKKIEAMSNEIQQDENAIKDFDENKNEYEMTKQNIEQYKSNVEILENIKTFLEKAQNNLDTKYVKPIKTKFDDYMKELNNIAPFSLDINRDFATQLIVNGETKSCEYLSSAQQSLCALCLLLALADNIYKGDIPFIVMDDPFVYLDENNISFVSQLLNKVLNNKQIIYLTCHESRKI